MSKIFKNIAPYWRSVIIILALLFVQAWCDLSLPSYTSDIIDVGIQNRGVEHVIPEEITEEDYTSAMLFMTEEEKTLWENSYEKEDSNYVRADLSEEELEGLDEELILPLLMGVVTVLVVILEHTAKKIPHAGIFFGILKEISGNAGGSKYEIFSSIRFTYRVKIIQQRSAGGSEVCLAAGGGTGKEGEAGRRCDCRGYLR